MTTSPPRCPPRASTLRGLGQPPETATPDGGTPGPEVGIYGSTWLAGRPDDAGPGNVPGRDEGTSGGGLPGQSAGKTASADLPGRP